MAKSRILIVGATGNLGRHLTKAGLEASHPTFALVRDSAFSDPLKSQLLRSLSDLGAIFLKGSLEDEESLFEAVKQVDVVISAVNSRQVLLQKHLVRAIKRAGCIKRFFPAEFGMDPDKTLISDLDSEYGIYLRRVEIRRLVESEGIPYTYICCNFYMSYFLPSLVQPGLKAPPRDKVTIFGDGNVKGVFVKEIDVASFTISTVDDPRTLNKAMYLRPPGNVYSINELVELWENKIGNKLQRAYMPEEEILRKIKQTPSPDNFAYIFIYAAFVKGDHTYFDIESSGGVEGTQLYPHIQYTTISEFLDTLLDFTSPHGLKAATLLEDFVKDTFYPSSVFIQLILVGMVVAAIIFSHEVLGTVNLLDMPLAGTMIEKQLYSLTPDTASTLVDLFLMGVVDILLPLSYAVIVGVHWDLYQRPLIQSIKPAGCIKISECGYKMERSRILIVGATGNLGFLLAKASLEASHPTFVLVRESSFSDHLKSQKIQSLSDLGAVVLKGSIEDEESLLNAVKLVEVVISAVSAMQALDQKPLIQAIKQAGCIKRFFPAEFGMDPSKIHISGMDYNIYTSRAEIRCLLEAEGIPHTYICCHYMMSYLLPSLVQPGLKAPPRDKITIFGNGNVKGVFVKETDVASFTISAVDDPCMLNKTMYLRPPGNVYSINGLVELWETKIGRKLERSYVPQEELLMKIKEAPFPENLHLAFIYSAFVKGDHTYFDIESSGGVEGAELYPEVTYTTVSEYLDTLC